MNNLEDVNYINRLYDELNSSRNNLMNDLKNDKECVKEVTLNKKISCVDTILKSLLKYRNITAKDKLKADL
jgi:hypothetical protein